ncbi:hypothetical protein ML462_13940 [Gramella lutea]|uniref:Uncharacterized protein n=1 Tax=Christiangramia lutea TaxID=1607951 RepID=A0A9X1V8B2_9FLAO|nr:hypothetical protein [Christiangramia lutea]MCH4824273.1 hypothetical protein [Christiangramia lutea]
MSVEIIQETDRDLKVNGKKVSQDMDGMWKGLQELTDTEKRFLGEYIMCMEISSAPLNATFTV